MADPTHGRTNHNPEEPVNEARAHLYRRLIEEIKMVEDTPDDLVHELFTQSFWEGHPLGRPILGTRGNDRRAHPAKTARVLRSDLQRRANLVIAAVGNLQHEGVRELVFVDFGQLPGRAGAG